MVGNRVAVGLTRSAITNFAHLFFSQLKRQENNVHMAVNFMWLELGNPTRSFTLRYQFEGNACATAVTSGREGRCSVPS